MHEVDLETGRQGMARGRGAPLIGPFLENEPPDS